MRALRRGGGWELSGGKIWLNHFLQGSGYRKAKTGSIRLFSIEDKVDLTLNFIRKKML